MAEEPAVADVPAAAEPAGAAAPAGAEAPPAADSPVLRRLRPGADQIPPATSVNSAPPAGKTKGIVIAAVVVALAVICIAALALLGGGAKAEPVIGHWEMYAVYDSDTESTQIAPRNAGYFVEFRKDGSATLQIGDDLAYECSWSFNQSKSDEEDRYYNMQCDDIPGFTAMLTDLSGVDSVMIVIPACRTAWYFSRHKKTAFGRRVPCGAVKRHSAPDAFAFRSAVPFSPLESVRKK